jgi:hypothetical protein
MEPQRRTWVVAVLVLMAAVTGAATILTVPALFEPQDGSQVRATAALGAAFVALALAAGHQRRRLLSADE